MFRYCIILISVHFKCPGRCLESLWIGSFIKRVWTERQPARLQASRQMQTDTNASKPQAEVVSFESKG